MDFQSASQVRLICPEYVAWVRDQESILLVDTRSDIAYRLTGLGAAVWLWLPQLYPYPALIDFAADVLQGDRSAAEVALWLLLDDWLSNGWLLVGRQVQDG